jgi:hypothetical protein
MKKYCFSVRPQMVPAGLIEVQGRLAGLRFQRTRVEDGRAVPIEGKYEDVRAPLVVSSIGSIPEPMDGIERYGQFYPFAHGELGLVAFGFGVYSHPAYFGCSGKKNEYASISQENQVEVLVLVVLL